MNVCKVSLQFVFLLLNSYFSETSPSSTFGTDYQESSGMDTLASSSEDPEEYENDGSGLEMEG